MPGAGSRSLVVTLAVTGVVLVAALAGAVLLRPRPVGSAAPGHGPITTQSSQADLPEQCGNGPCQLLTSATAGDSTVRLLADNLTPSPDQTQNGRVQFRGRAGTTVFETNISQDEAVLTPSSLSCLSRPVPACIVFGEYSQHNQKAGALGEVFVERGGYWARPSYGLFYSSAGYFTLWEADGDTAPQVITVQNDCPNSGDSGQCADAKVYVQLFSLGVDNPKSCTKSVGAISLLPGHGTVLPPATDLRACPKSAG
ncbi:MAG TPA: hypothetical protein VEO01_07050 [Pseudonocardiaceae bacterium]|nr:hypothetical protein [Pseudonocardiaceae bacterium]